jgi:cytochrome c-type biogenesis protein CcmH
MRRTRGLSSTALVVALALACLPASTAAVARHGPGTARQVASLPDIEDEVMCPSCGTPLALAFSPQAERERRFIRRQIELGRTKQQIEQALVREYGKQVLALPRAEGFDLFAYLVPALVLSLAVLAISLSLIRWRRRPPRQSAAAPPPLGAADAQRLDRDLARYDV